MTIQHARLRALYSCVVTAAVVLSLSSPARADDGTSTAPRAVAIARSIPRTFSSYNALIATASAVATDQTTLWAKFLVARTDADSAKANIAMVSDPRIRGGLVRTESNVSDEPTLTALRAAVASDTATEAQLVASGATDVAPMPTWQRPLVGEVSQPFGPTSFGLEPARLYKGVSYTRFHDGVDILAAPGTPILAPARGRVVFAGRMMDSAEVVVIAHDNGLVSLYAHLEDGPLAPTVKAGDIIQTGDRIGAVGLTGLTTGYHLHWAVYKNGEPLDPLSTLGG